MFPLLFWRLNIQSQYDDISTCTAGPTVCLQFEPFVAEIFWSLLPNFGITKSKFPPLIVFLSLRARIYTITEFGRGALRNRYGGIIVVAPDSKLLLSPELSSRDTNRVVNEPPESITQGGDDKIMGYTISIRYIENPPFQDKGQIRNLQQKLIERATIAVNSQVRIRTTTRTICINQATAPGVNKTPIIVVAEVINDWIGNCLRAASPVDARVSNMRVSTRILTRKLAGMSQPISYSERKHCTYWVGILRRFRFKKIFKFRAPIWPTSMFHIDRRSRRINL